MTNEELLKVQIDIKQCRRRKRVYKQLLKKIDNLDFNNLTFEEMSYIELAIKRSLGIEQLNIASLKNGGMNNDK